MKTTVPPLSLDANIEEETSQDEQSMESHDIVSECGHLGGRGVFEAFGTAAEGLLPDLVANWVTGHLSQEKASEFIGGGTVTSTVIHCWMAAILEKKSSDSEKSAQDRLVCTGVLVHTDLVITSAACTVEWV